MNPFDLPPLAAVLVLASSALAALGALVTPAGAVVLVTVTVRAALLPAAVAVARAAAARRRLAPRLAELRRRYRSNPERLRRETLALYAAARVSPFAGCLPALAQAPVLTLVYAVFASPSIGGEPNALLQATLFGAPLGRHLTDLASGVVPTDLVFAVVLGVVLLVALMSRRAIRRVPRDSAEPAAALAAVAAWAPFLGVLAACVVPLAATLYLAVSGIWTSAERAVLGRIFAADTA